MSPHYTPRSFCARSKRTSAPWAAALLSTGLAAFAAEANNPDLTQLSLEQLMQVQVTSVSKKPEKLFDAPAPIFVITGDDIRRSGATSIPQALRMAAGLDVAQVDAHNWAISDRGFNDVFANKLLVMVDGRSVYTPLYSGVFWDVQDTLLEDIDRIEVVRGPGAALWGANAVNGVINIITKSAKDTQGTLLLAGGGSEMHALAGVQYGGKISDNAYYRVYVKYEDTDNSRLPNGTTANDGSQITRGGFRLDWNPSMENHFTLQGDAYDGTIRQTFLTVTPAAVPQTIKDNYPVTGGNLLGRWTRDFSDTSQLTVQTYYDGSRRDTAIFRENRDTFDLDVQHRFDIGERNEILWGLGYRVSHDDIGGSYTFTTLPAQMTTQLASAHVSDTISLIPDRLKLILGTEMEHNDFTGFEVQPNARLAWTPTSRFTIYSSVSRAVRTPSRAEDGVTINTQGPFPGSITSIRGNNGFDSEKLVAYDLGFRTQVSTNFAIGMAAFYNVYDDLRTLEPGAPSGVPLVIPLTAMNNMRGETYGLETGPRWQVTDWWLLQGTYTLQQMQLHLVNGSLDTQSIKEEGQSPHHQLSLRTAFTLGRHWEFDSGVRYVSRLGAMGIPAYSEMDAQLVWRPRPGLEISLVGQNLLHAQHQEFAPTLIPTQATDIQRSVYAKVTWRF